MRRSAQETGRRHSTAIDGEWLGVRVRVLGREALIRNKMAADARRIFWMWSVCERDAVADRHTDADDLFGYRWTVSAVFEF